jgi:hypothetical protein
MNDGLERQLTDKYVVIWFVCLFFCTDETACGGDEKTFALATRSLSPSTSSITTTSSSGSGISESAASSSSSSSSSSLQTEQSHPPISGRYHRHPQQLESHSSTIATSMKEDEEESIAIITGGEGELISSQKTRGGEGGKFVTNFITTLANVHQSIN